MSEAFKLTPAEVAIIAQTSALSTAYFALPVEHPNARSEFVIAMHRIQDLIASRPVWRAINAADDPFNLGACGGDPVPDPDACPKSED